MGRRSGTKEELIKCEYCGEMYAASYKHCPFCNEDGTGRWDDPDAADDDYYDDDLPVHGGRRLVRHSRSGGTGGNGPSVGRIISWVLSLALIIAAAGIVISLIKPLLGKGKDPKPSPSVPPVEVSTEPSMEPIQPTQPVQPSGEPVVTPEPQPTAPGIQTPSVPLVTPTDFKLSREDISFFAVGETYQFKVTLTPADAHGDIVWKSSDPNVASVSWNGLVTAVSKGTVTVTASIEGVGERSCVVRCQLSGGASSSATTPPATTTSTPPSSSGANLSLNREDFTLGKEGETWRLIVSGTSSAVTWTSSDPAVATVGADGTVTAVGKGTCRVTATVDGVTLKCVVRCSF